MFSALPVAFRLGIHLLAGHVHQLLLGVNEGIRSLAGQAPVNLSASSSWLSRVCHSSPWCFFSNDIQELLLRVDEDIEAVAGGLDHSLAGVALAGLHRGQPGVCLFAGDLQEILLHLDKSVETTAHQIGHGDGRRKPPTRSFTPVVTISYSCCARLRSSFCPSMKLDIPSPASSVKTAAGQ